MPTQAEIDAMIAEGPPCRPTAEEPGDFMKALQELDTTDPTLLVLMLATALDKQTWWQERTAYGQIVAMNEARKRFGTEA